MKPSNPPRWLLVSAFLSIYIVWGTTYLAIRFALETLTPFLFAGARFLCAGSLLYAWTRLRGTPAPRPGHWAGAALVGGLLLLGGNGGVVWAEQRVPSGLAALMVGAVPLWMVLMERLVSGVKLDRMVVPGLVLGFSGVALLADPLGLAKTGRMDPLGALVLLLSGITWAAGTVFSRRVALPQSVFQATAMQMLCGGGLQILTGLALGEAPQWDWNGISAKSAWAFLYLVVFGSLLAFTACIWLLKVSTPAKVSTYAFVNPIVAVFAGWAFAGEAVTGRTLLAGALVVAGVVLMMVKGEATNSPRRTQRPRRDTE